MERLRQRPIQESKWAGWFLFSEEAGVRRAREHWARAGELLGQPVLSPDSLVGRIAAPGAHSMTA